MDCHNDGRVDREARLLGDLPRPKPVSTGPEHVSNRTSVGSSLTSTDISILSGIFSIVDRRQSTEVRTSTRHSGKVFVRVSPNQGTDGVNPKSRTSELKFGDIYNLSTFMMSGS